MTSLTPDSSCFGKKVVIQRSAINGTVIGYCISMEYDLPAFLVRYPVTEIGPDGTHERSWVDSFWEDTLTLVEND